MSTENSRLLHILEPAELDSDEIILFCSKNNKCKDKGSDSERDRGNLNNDSKLVHSIEYDSMKYDTDSETDTDSDNNDDNDSDPDSFGLEKEMYKLLNIQVLTELQKYFEDKVIEKYRRNKPYYISKESRDHRFKRSFFDSLCVKSDTDFNWRTKKSKQEE